MAVEKALFPFVREEFIRLEGLKESISPALTIWAYSELARNGLFPSTGLIQQAVLGELVERKMP